MRYSGKKLIVDEAEFTAWVREVLPQWASDSLNDEDAAEKFGLDNPPASYPVVVVWKGVREFELWYVYPEDFDVALRGKSA